MRAIDQSVFWRLPGHSTPQRYTRTVIHHKEWTIRTGRRTILHRRSIPWNLGLLHPRGTALHHHSGNKISGQHFGLPGFSPTIFLVFISGRGGVRWRRIPRFTGSLSAGPAGTGGATAVKLAPGAHRPWMGLAQLRGILQTLLAGRPWWRHVLRNDPAGKAPDLLTPS